MLYLGADHNGYFLKERLKLFLTRQGLPWRDLGAKSLVKSDDYVDFAKKVGERVGSGDLGLLVCGSGHGMVVAANKLPDIRAIMPLNPKSARDGRRDDHANILVLAAWQMKAADAERIVAGFLSQRPGKAARYLRRLRKIKNLER